MAVLLPHQAPYPEIPALNSTVAANDSSPSGSSIAGTEAALAVAGIGNLIAPDILQTSLAEILPIACCGWTGAYWAGKANSGKCGADDSQARLLSACGLVLPVLR